MIIIMKQSANQKDIDSVVDIIKNNGLDVHISTGKEVTLIGVIGDKTKLQNQNIEIANGVDKIVPITESYKLANRKMHPEDTKVTVKNTVIGGDEFVIMSGPCAVESYDQLRDTALAIKKSGAQILRGGAFKPRTSPYSFQGLEEQGLKYMYEVGQETGLAVITEVTSREALEAAIPYVDMLQIGARNMQNFYLLKEVGKTKLPVLLKRGLCATIDEWLNAAEYIISEGNPNVVLCERGIRTYETATRNTLDIQSIPYIKYNTNNKIKQGINIIIFLNFFIFFTALHKFKYFIILFCFSYFC